jgi:hypothetical protein
MKIKQTISVRIVFLLVALFCLVVNAYSNYNMGQFSADITLGTATVENTISLNFDSFEDDQIVQTYEFSPIVVHSCPIPIPQSCYLIHKILFSIWQPPEIS